MQRSFENGYGDVGTFINLISAALEKVSFVSLNDKQVS